MNIHEFQLHSNEGWVVCHTFQKAEAHAHPAAQARLPRRRLSTARQLCHHARHLVLRRTCPSAPAARSLMSGAAPAPPAAHDHGGLAHESKLHMQLITDMPPLQIPAVDGGMQHHSYNADHAAAAVAAESMVDWNLLSCLLPLAAEFP